MNVSKNLSIGKEYIDRIEPYIEKHNANLGVALGELIYQLEMCNSNTNIDRSLSDWMFKGAEGRLVPDNVIDEIIPPNLINSMKKLGEYLNDRFIEWHVNINLEADSDTLPSFILIEIRGSTSKIKVAAGILSKYLIRHSSSPIGIKSVATFDECIRIEFCMMDKNKSLQSLSTFFGYTDEILNIIRQKQNFWKAIIEMHKSSNYNMVTIHRNHFEELLTDDISRTGEITIETLTKNIVRDIPLEELLHLIKNVYENSRIADRIEIDKFDLVLYHSYRNQKAVDKLKNILISLLENSGHLYNAKSTSNMIILSYIPDIDIKINQIVSNLKNSENIIDQELVIFIICLNGLNDMHVSLSSTSLGKKIGKILIKEYEKENNYNDNWDTEKFKKFFEEIDSKLLRVSTWKSDNGSYAVNKCNISRNQYTCQTIREMFKGALNYAFGDNATIEIKKKLDNSCEVIIRTK